MVTLVCVTLLAQVKSAKNPAGDWPTYNHDLAGTRYSPLTQITPSNVGKLKLAWAYRPSETGGRPSPQAVPLVVNGRMYLTAGLRIVALEPETGSEIWRYQVTGGNPSQRGVAYWPGEETILRASSSPQARGCSPSTPTRVSSILVSARKAWSIWAWPTKVCPPFSKIP